MVMRTDEPMRRGTVDVAAVDPCIGRVPTTLDELGCVSEV
jgi:hypothetical protein